MNDLKILHGDNLSILKSLPSESFNLIYIDPPFNTNVKQIRTTPADSNSKFYDNTIIKDASYEDSFDDYKSFIYPRLEEAYRLLTPTGSLFVHLDYREVHYVKIYLDEIFGRDSFINEIIWSYDYGARTKKKWPTKHDNILFFAKNPKNYTYHYDQIDTIPYLAPGRVSKEKQEKGKPLTDVWWNSIVHTNSKFEKTGYPTQKPIKIIERIVKVHSNQNDNLLDFFAGSGTFGEAALLHGRNVTLIDENPQAIEVINKRLNRFKNER